MMMRTILILCAVILAILWLLPKEEPAAEPDSVTEPVATGPVDAKRLDVVSFDCGPNSAYYSAKITVRNLTSSEVSFPNVFVQFQPNTGSPFMDSVNISPRHLPAGAMGDATLISHNADGQRYDCTLMRIQDSSGARVD